MFLYNIKAVLGRVSPFCVAIDSEERVSECLQGIKKHSFTDFLSSAFPTLC